MKFWQHAAIVVVIFLGSVIITIAAFAETSIKIEPEPETVLDFLPAEAEKAVEVVPGIAMFYIDDKCFILENDYSQMKLKGCGEYDE